MKKKLSIFTSSCYHCQREMLMVTKGKKLKQYACSKCVPKDDGFRDSINETFEYEFMFLSGK